MFFTLTRTHPIYLHPALFGPSLKTYIHGSLLSEVEGTCDGHYYTIAVLDITNVSGGRIRSGVGKAEFRVEYEALVWKPFVGEVLFATVSKINELGLFVEAGPMSIFISSHLVPGDISFAHDNQRNPIYADRNENSVIELGSLVRMRICGIRRDAGMIYAIGTLNQDYLGTL